MEDSGFLGTGSRFSSRFEAGSQIGAKQLNDLASGIQASLPMPYLGAGPSVSYTPGGSIITYTPPLVTTPPTPWQPRRNDDDSISIWPGTINSLIPCVGGHGSSARLATASPTPSTPLDWSAVDEQGFASCYIYLQSSPAASSGGRIWPSSDFTTAEYPVIFGYPTTMEDDDDTGYLLLALAKKKADPDPTKEVVEFTQFIFTSIWSERHKYSQPNSAYYYYYRV